MFAGRRATRHAVRQCGSAGSGEGRARSSATRNLSYSAWSTSNTCTKGGNHRHAYAHARVRSPTHLLCQYSDIQRRLSPHSAVSDPTRVRRRTGGGAGVHNPAAGYHAARLPRHAGYHAAWDTAPRGTPTCVCALVRVALRSSAETDEPVPGQCRASAGPGADRQGAGKAGTAGRHGNGREQAGKAPTGAAASARGGRGQLSGTLSGWI